MHVIYVWNLFPGRHLLTFDELQHKDNLHYSARRKIFMQSSCYILCPSYLPLCLSSSLLERFVPLEAESGLDRGALLLLPGKKVSTILMMITIMIIMIILMIMMMMIIIMMTTIIKMNCYDNYDDYY